MRRLLPWIGTLAALVSAAAGPRPATAQPAAAPAPRAEFPDVPADQWAADAIRALAALGIFTGYPDGTFGGRRALTRYEFAAAMQRVLGDVQKQIDAAIAAHEAKPHGGTAPAPPPPGASRAEVDELARGNEQLRRDVDELRRIFTDLQTNAASLRRDVDDLREMVGTVQPKPR
jgi:hypothetical protein